MTSKNNRVPLLYYAKRCASFQKPWVNSDWRYSPERPNSGQNRRIFVPCDFDIWQMTLKNNRAPLLCYFKLCALFCIHWWIQKGVNIRVIWVKIDKGQWRGALMFPLICAWINGCVNNLEAGGLRRHCAHYDVIVIWYIKTLHPDEPGSIPQ